MKTITKNIVSLTIGEALNLCLSFITTVYIARILGQSGFGKISFALAIFSYSVTALNFGILTIGLREVARDRKQTTTLVKTIFGLRFFLALLIFGVMLLLVYSVHRFQNLKTLIILYHLALFPFAFYLDWIFQGLESMETISYSKIIIPLVYLILVLIFIKTGNDLNKIPLFWFFAINVSTIYLLIVYISRFGMPWISFNLGAWLKIMRDALPVGTGRVLAEITRNFPVVILGFLKSDTLVGTYSAAQKLVFFLLILDRIFYTLLLPMMVRYTQNGVEQLKYLLENLSRLISIFIIPITIGTSVFGTPLIIFIYGQAYADSILPFQVLIWFFPLTIINTIFCSALIATNRESRYARGITIGMVVHFITIIIATQLWGLIGTALSVIISEIVTLSLMYFYFRPIYNLRFWKYLLRPLIASLIMAIIISLTTPKNLILGFITGVCSYSLILYLIRGITRHDLKILFSIFSLENIICKE